MKNIDKNTYIRLRKKYGSRSNADFAELLNNDYQTRNGKKFNKKLVESRNQKYGLKGLGDQRFQPKTKEEIIKLATPQQLEFYKATKDFQAFKDRVLHRQYDLNREPRSKAYRKKIRDNYIKRIGIKQYRADAAARMRRLRKKRSNLK